MIPFSVFLLSAPGLETQPQDVPGPEGARQSVISGQSMWSDKVEYVKLEKADKGLGFSILDYQVGLAPLGGGGKGRGIHHHLQHQL